MYRILWVIVIVTLCSVNNTSAQKIIEEKFLTQPDDYQWALKSPNVKLRNGLLMNNEAGKADIICSRQIGFDYEQHFKIETVIKFSPKGKFGVVFGRKGHDPHPTASTEGFIFSFTAKGEYFLYNEKGAELLLLKKGKINAYPKGTTNAKVTIEKDGQFWDFKVNNSVAVSMPHFEANGYYFGYYVSPKASIVAKSLTIEGTKVKLGAPKKVVKKEEKPKEVAEKKQVHKEIKDDHVWAENEDAERKAREERERKEREAAEKKRKEEELAAKKEAERAAAEKERQRLIAEKKANEAEKQRQLEAAQKAHQEKLAREKREEEERLAERERERDEAAKAKAEAERKAKEEADEIARKQAKEEAKRRAEEEKRRQEELAAAEKAAKKKAKKNKSKETEQSGSQRAIVANAAVFSEFEKINLGENVNDYNLEVHPIVSADDQTLLFTKLIPGKSPQYYISDMKGLGSWAKAEQVGRTFKNVHLNKFWNVSADGVQLLVSPDYSDTAKASRGFRITKMGIRGWGFPTSMRIPNFRDYDRDHNATGFLCSDQHTMIFSGASMSHSRKHQLFVTFKEGKGWSEPKSLGSLFNSDKFTTSHPFLAADGKTLYFSSDRSGFGDKDLFMTRRLDDSWAKWSTPINLGEKINTAQADTSISVSPSGQFIYVTLPSERKHTKDVYKVELPQEYRPDPVMRVHGSLVFENTLEAVRGQVVAINKKNGEIETFAWTDPTSGKYTLVLRKGGQYELEVVKSKGDAPKLEVSTVGITDYKTKKHDFHLSGL